MAERHGYGWSVECWEHGCRRGDANLKFRRLIFKRDTYLHSFKIFIIFDNLPSNLIYCQDFNCNVAIAAMLEFFEFFAVILM